jgi:Domain of unknown function (DUF4062)
MEKRYQVFVSSTSVDLSRERRAVIEALYEASYFPVGMEFFNAATEAAWPTIEKIIDSCDYYVVISAGRYGSQRPTGISFTESEYDYATQIAKPRLAFLYKDLDQLPRKKTEPTDEGAAKVETFRSRLMTDLLCKFWRNGSELARQVVGGLNAAIQSNPQPGWIRADSLDALPGTTREDILIPSQSLGIGVISPDGQASVTMRNRIASAKAIAIMSTSAARLIEIQKPYLVEALTKGCQIRVLVPEIGGRFVRDVEESERRTEEHDSISDEIRIVRRRLFETVMEAAESSTILSGRSLLGKVQIGHFSTHLRSTMVLCDDTWGWLTITLPPARAPETPSFELNNTGRSPLLRTCVRHFNRTWQIVEGRGNAELIEPEVEPE